MPTRNRPNRAKVRNSSGPITLEKSKEVTPRPVILLIVGPHRSGTSAVTRLLECLGAENSSRLIAGDANNPTGYFEDADINTFNDTVLLPRLGLTWHSIGFVDWSRLNKTDRSRLGLQALEIVRRNYPANRPLSILKEPRIGTLLPFWLSVLTHAGFDVRIVGCVRDPVSVARSLTRRDGFSMTHGGMLYTTMWLSVLPHIQDLPVALAEYDTVCNQPGKALRAVAEKLALPLPADVEERLHDFASNHLDLRLRHSRLPAEDVALELELPPLAAHLHQALLGAARAQNIKKAARFALASDRIVEAFRPVLADFDQMLVGARGRRPAPEAPAPVAPVPVADTTATEALTRERDQLAAQLAETQAAREELAARLAAAEVIRQETADRQATLAETTARLAATEQELQQLRSNAEQHEQERGAVTRLEELERCHEDLVARHRTLVGERASLESEHSDLASRHSSLATELDGLRHELIARQAVQSEMRAKLAAAEQDITEARAAREETEAAARDKAEQNELLLSQLHQVHAELEKHFLDNREAEAARHAALQSTHSEMAARAAELDGLRHEMSARQAVLAESQAKLAAAEQALAEARTTRGQTEAEAKNQAEENELLLAQLHQVQEELEKYFLENRELKQSADQFHATKQAHQALQALHQELAESHAQLVTRHTTLVTERETLLAERDVLTAKYAALEVEQQTTLERRDDLAMELEKVAERRDDLEAAMQERFKELAELTKRLISTEDAWQEASQGRDHLAARIAGLEVEHSELVTRHSSLVTEREALNAAHAELKSRLRRTEKALRRERQGSKEFSSDGWILGPTSLGSSQHHPPYRHLNVYFAEVEGSRGRHGAVKFRLVQHNGHFGFCFFAAKGASPAVESWRSCGEEGEANYMLVVPESKTGASLLAQLTPSDRSLVNTALVAAERAIRAKASTDKTDCLLAEVWLPCALSLREAVRPKTFPWL